MSTSELRAQGCLTVPVDWAPLETLDTEKLWQLEHSSQNLIYGSLLAQSLYSLEYRLQSTYCTEQQ